MRTFRDTAGTEWTVFEVRRANDETNWDYLPRRFRTGWLCFESGVGKRRFYPVPPEWDGLPDDKLELLCRSAVAVSARPSAVEAG